MKIIAAAQQSWNLPYDRKSENRSNGLNYLNYIKNINIFRISLLRGLLFFKEFQILIRYGEDCRTNKYN